MARAMTVAEREAFLAEVRPGVLSVAEAGRAPLTVPMWYRYEPGGAISFITPRHSRKADLIREAGRVSLCVHSAEVPYKYVSVEGPITAVQESVTAAERRALAHRYLGQEDGDRYVDSSADRTPEMILIQMTPEHWLTQDQTT